MILKFQQKEALYADFLPLLIELECGEHYNKENPQHVVWLRHRVKEYYDRGGKALCMYTDRGGPVGFLLYLYDKGLEGVRFFGKKASIAMFGLLEEYRTKGIAQSLLEEVEGILRESGCETLYVDTYCGNEGAIRYYVRHGFTPVALHPGEYGRDDKGQVYLYKTL